MGYLQVFYSISTTELIEIAMAELSEIGYDGFEFTEIGLCAYIPEEYYNEANMLEAIQFYPDIKWLYTQPLPDINWNAEWENNFEPLIIGGKLLVQAPFHAQQSLIKENYTYTITIDPNMAFGTGHHETTALMLEALLEMNLKGHSFLDFGCGTAILAIMAGLKGAANIVCIDNDAHACKIAAENLLAHQLHNISTVIVGNDTAIATAPNQPYKTIVANITRNIILESLANLTHALAAGGSLLLSGLLHADVPFITNALQNYPNLQVKNVTYKTEWCLIEVLSLV